MRNGHCGKTHFGMPWVHEALILSEVYRGESVYGYRLAKANMPDISESAVYPILRRLQGNGYLEARTQTHNHRIRKMYRITAKGKEYYGKLIADWISVKESMDGLL